MVDDTGHDLAERISNAKDELTKSAKEKKYDFDQILNKAISNMSYNADDIIENLGRKLEDLKKRMPVYRNELCCKKPFSKFDIIFKLSSDRPWAVQKPEFLEKTRLTPTLNFFFQTTVN